MAKYLQKPDSLPPGTRHLFLAEGRAEVGLLRQLLKSLCAGDDAAILCAEGVERIPQLIKRLVQPPAMGDLRSVTVVADADSDPSSRRKRIWDALPMSDSACASGKVEGSTVAGSPRYAVWLSPDNSRCGRIEDLVLETIDPSIVDEIRHFWRRVGHRNKDANPSSKAIVAIWIALCANEGFGLGTAFERGLIDLDHRAFEPLRQVIDQQLSYRGPASA